MKIFRKQQDAFDACLETEFTYAVNYPASKSCIFVNATEKDFWDNYMQDGLKNNYEKIRIDKPCHLFLDIDKKTSQYPGVDIEEIWEDLKYVIEVAFEHLLHIQKHRLTFIKLQSHCEKKQSLHIIVKVEGTIFKNLIHCGIFVNNLKHNVKTVRVGRVGKNMCRCSQKK